MTENHKRAPIKFNRKTNIKPAIQRKIYHRKNRTKPHSILQDKGNSSSIVNGQGSPESKTDDFHERNWWKTNEKKAATLIESCIKSYSWERAETKKILRAYRQFLVLKKEHADWNATILSPCWPVDQMWLQHSQTDDYNYDMRNLLGHVAHFSNNWSRLPTGSEEKARQESTKEALNKRFRSYDEDLWNETRMIIRDQLGEEEMFEINIRKPMSAVFKLYTQHKKEGLDMFEFVFDGKTISKEDTPMALGIQENNKIEATRINKVAVTIRCSIKMKERGFLVENTAMIYNIFDEFTREVLDTERSALVFLFQENRVYGYESPIALKLKSRDNIIHVVPARSYKACKNCVCCNSNHGRETKNEQSCHDAGR